MQYRYGTWQRGAMPLKAKQSLPFDRFHFGHPSSRGQGFVKFAVERLPELDAVIDMSTMVNSSIYPNAT
jgi:hypothetical protein